MTEKVLLIDGHSLAFRNFYAVPVDKFTAPTGESTNAIYGFLTTLARIMRTYQPTHIAVAFDLPGGTFRTREYGEYKAGRAATPPEFKTQVPRIQEALEATGIPWFTVEDYEADDIVATLTKLSRESGREVIIASGDRDAFQLITDTTFVLWPGSKEEVLLDSEGIVEKYGVRPEQYPDMAALVGEKADNLPGIPGVGVKTAAKWLTTYGTLADILDHAGDIGGKVGQNLRDNIDLARRNRELNTLVDDLSIINSLDDIRFHGADHQRLGTFFDTLGMVRLRKPFFAAFPEADGAGPAAPTFPEFEHVGGTLAEFCANATEPIGLWTTTEAGDISTLTSLVAVSGARLWTTETVSSEDIAALDTPGTYSQPLYVADLKALIHGCAGNLVRAVTTDVRLLAYVLDPSDGVREISELAALYASVHLDEASEPIQDDLFATATINWDESARYAWALPRLAAALYERPEFHESRDDVVNLLAMEHESTRCLARMEIAGIAMDRERLEELFKDADSRVARAEQIAFEAAGHSLSLSSPKQIQAVLFDEMQLPPTKKNASGGYTTNADALRDLLTAIAFREDDAAEKGRTFLTALLEHRDAIRLRQTITGLLTAIGRDGRIHTTFQQTVTATGRLSSVDPNLQNIHARSEAGLQLREAFVAGEGYETLMTADYSQIEMRLMAHLSGDQTLIDAFRAGEDLHAYVASKVYHIPVEAVTPAQRSKIKAMSYGLAYGLSVYGLAQQLGIERYEAQELMDGYFSRFGKVRDYLAAVVDQARADGFTSTICGRRRYLPELGSSNFRVREQAERAALNAPIQGSAADIIKIAMCEVERALRAAGLTSRILLQVHDELVLEIAHGELDAVREIVETHMADVVPLSVPLPVGIGVGPTWRAAAH